MIIAIGTDAIEVERVARAVDHPRWGARFRQRVYTAGEIAYCTRRRRNAESFAARFAAKEAVMKALGTGYAKGVWWRDIEVVRNSGPPRIVLHGGAAARARTLGVRHWHLTLTHTAGQALATVIAEA
jgi:holo-[acyl-carrier protein] synthase